MLARRDPSFFSFYLLNEHWHRFFNTRVPIDYVTLSVAGFWTSTVIWLLPWSLFLPGAIRGAMRLERRRLAIPVLWSAVVIGFFTLSHARLEYYAMPAFPALAVVVAAYWQRVFQGRIPHWELQTPALCVLVAALGGAPLFLYPAQAQAFLTALVSNVDGYYREYFALHPGASFALVTEAMHLARPFVALLFLIGSGVALLMSMSRRRLAFALLVAALIPSLEIVDLGMRIDATDRSQREIARAIDRNWADDARLVVVGPYEDFCGVTYYTHRTTEMVDGFGQDLLFGYRKGDAATLFLTFDEFLRQWNSAARVFVVSDRSFELPGGEVLAEGPRDILRVNHLR